MADIRDDWGYQQYGSTSLGCLTWMSDTVALHYSDVGLETRSRSRDLFWLVSVKGPQSLGLGLGHQGLGSQLVKASRDHGKFRIFYLFYHLFLSLHSPGLT